MVEVITALGTALKVGKLAAMLVRVLERLGPTHAHKELRDEEFRLWVAETAGRLAERGDELEALAAKHAELETSAADRDGALAVKHSDLEGTLEALLSDRQFERVMTNYTLEAYREAMDERRRMLAYAAAGSVNVELSLAEIARVERVLRELDPKDVLLLEAIAADDDRRLSRTATDDSDVAEDHHADYRAIAGWEQQSLAALVAAGCVFAPPPYNLLRTAGEDPRRVTPLGELVLVIMRGFLNAQRVMLPRPDKES